MTHWGVLLTFENDSNKVYPSIENLDSKEYYT